MKNIKEITSAFVIGFILIAQIMSPGLAYADGDDDTPVPTDTPVETSTPAPTETINSPTETSSPVPTDTVEATFTTVPTEPREESVETDTPTPSDTPEATSTSLPAEPTDEPLETETPIPPTEPIETSVPNETATPDEPIDIVEPTLSEALQELPGDTSVVVLDENGEPLSLATQAAADAIITGDPIWCPAGQAPTPGLNGCTASFATMAQLLTSQGTIINSQNVNGTIWITSGAVGDVIPISIDGSIYTNWSNYELTLQGGWNGVSGSTAIGSNSVFTIPITITNWKNGITIQNLDVPSITLSNANIQNNGISVKNVNGNVNLSNINVTRVDGVFGHGVKIENSGNVNMSNIIARANKATPGDGAFLTNVGNVTLTGSNNFSDHNNGSSGMYIVSNGDVTLDGITSNNNGRGVNISQAGNVTITNGTFDNNYYDGASIFSNGGVTIDNSTFSGNDQYGAYIVSTANVNIDGSTFSQNFIGAEIFLLGEATILNSSFNSNQYDGLRIFGNGGNVMINNSQFNNNNSIGWDGYGAWISAGTAGDITVINSEFNNNFAGLVAFSSNNIYILQDNIDNQFQNNYFGLIYYDCRGNLVLDPTTIFLGNIYDTYNGGGCPDLPTVPIVTRLTPGTFALDCASQDGYSIPLPNGDLVEIYCPVSGLASIVRKDSIVLPANLPDGYTYASAFEVEITQNNQPIKVITEGGYIRSSFVATTLRPGSSFGILYWDSDTAAWIPLKDFLIDNNNHALTFNLFPGDPEDTRKVLSGVKLVDKYYLPRIEVTTNFPGIFVLAQH